MTRSFLFTFFTLFALLSPLLGAAQSIEWEKNYGGSQHEFCVEHQVTPDGGFILAGWSRSSDGDLGTGHGGSDAWVVKLDSTGTIEWERQYGGSNDDAARSIRSTSDGAYVLAGESESYDGDLSSNEGKEDLWVWKIGKDGTLQWSKSFGGAEEEGAYTIEEAADGGYIVGGSTRSNAGDISDPQPNGCGQSNCMDFWVLKLDPNGNLEWERSLGGSYDESCNSIDVVPEGGYIATGWTKSDNGQVSNFKGKRDVWTVRLDANGNLIWEETYGGTDWEEASSVRSLKGGGFVALASVISNDGDVSGHHGGNDAWLLRIDSAGSLLWQRCYGGSNTEDETPSVRRPPWGGFILGAPSKSSDGDLSENNGGYDYWVVRVAPDGTLEWERSLGGPATDWVRHIEAIAPGRFLITGDARQAGGDVSDNKGASDYWAVELRAEEEIYNDWEPDGKHASQSERELYIPNVFAPASRGDIENQRFRVHGGPFASYHLQIFSRWGEMVFETQDPSEAWDGTHRGEPMQSGAFAYQFRGSYPDGTKIERSGTVTLIR